MGSVIPPTCRTQPKSRTWGRAWVAFIVALLVLALAAPADAKKKKKGGKKGKTPSGKTTGGAKAPVDADDETDSASSDEKEPTPSKPSSDSSSTGGDDKPPAPSDADEVTKKPVKADKPAAEPEDSEGSGLPALQFGVGGKALFRTLSWTDDGGTLAPYSLSPGPEVGVWLEAYPAAFATTGFAANIGIFGSFNYGIGAKSKTAGATATELTTKYQDFLVGLKVRIPLGMFNPYVSGAYGGQTFKLDPVAADRPNFNYSFIRPGAGVRIQATPMVDIEVGAGFLIVNGLGTQPGELKSAMFFPRATASGIDAGLSIGVRFSNLIGVRVGGDFRQYGMTSGFQAGDTTPRAGGATDRYITAWGGVEILLDGAGGGPAGGGDEEAAPAKKAPAKKAAPPSDEPDEEKTEKE